MYKIAKDATMYNSPMYHNTFTNSTLQYSELSDQTYETLTYELWGSSLCIKTKFIELLLTENKHSFIVRRAPLGYQPTSLVYGELPALRQLPKEEEPPKSRPDWIEDFRMIWYHLEGQSLTAETHLAAREFLDVAFSGSLSNEQVALIQRSRAPVQFDLRECQLKLLTKLYYRYITWPRKQAQLRRHQCVVNHLANRKGPLQGLAKIQKRYEQAHNCITELLRALT